MWHSRRLLLAGRRFEIEFSFSYDECCVVLRFYILMLTIAIFAGVVFFCYILRLFKIMDKEGDTRGEWIFLIVIIYFILFFIEMEIIDNFFLKLSLENINLFYILKCKLIRKTNRNDTWLCWTFWRQ